MSRRSRRARTQKPKVAIPAKGHPKTSISATVVARAGASRSKKRYAYDIRPPFIMPGVVPKGESAPVMAFDYSTISNQYASTYVGFPGYAYLANLTTRAEYRNAASALSTEITREWIEFYSDDTEDESISEKIKEIEDEFKRLKVRSIINKACMHDCFYGKAQIGIDLKGKDKATPMILSPKTIGKGSLDKIVVIDPIWTTPAAYNSNDPFASDFFVPSMWFVLGQEIHATMLITVITRDVPDILKPAFNFGGISLSQLMEPYVENWLRTRQSVSDLINNFSLTALQTAMDEVLSGSDDGDSLLNRADLFATLKSNKGLMLLDKERENLIQLNTPLSGLYELQAQSQEHLCSVTRQPAIIQTGISPSGLNASSEGEIRMWESWISAQQEAHWREPIETILKVVQLSLYGSIEDRIGFKFVPLHQMDDSDHADIRLKNSQSSVALIDAGVISPMEERKRLAEDPDSGYQGLDVEEVPEIPDNPEFNQGEPMEEDTPAPAQDSDVESIFIRGLAQDERSTKAMVKAISQIQPKDGFIPVYRPYGEFGRGFYYVRCHQ